MEELETQILNLDLRIAELEEKVRMMSGAVEKYEQLHDRLFEAIAGEEFRGILNALQ